MCIRDRPRTPPFQGGNTGSNPVGGAVCPSALLLVGDLWCSLECTPACQAGGRGFKSRQVRHLGPPRRGRVAQLVERAPEKREVTGSTPVPTTEEVTGQGVADLATSEPTGSPCHTPAPHAAAGPGGGPRPSGRAQAVVDGIAIVGGDVDAGRLGHREAVVCHPDQTRVGRRG